MDAVIMNGSLSQFSLKSKTFVFAAHLVTSLVIHKV